MQRLIVDRQDIRVCRLIKVFLEMHKHYCQLCLITKNLESDVNLNVLTDMIVRRSFPKLDGIQSPISQWI